MLGDAFCPPDTHLHVWRNIISSRHYLSHRNSPFCTDMWGVLRGAMEPINFVRNMEAPNCCSATGSYREIYSELHEARDHTTYDDTLPSLRGCFYWDPICSRGECVYHEQKMNSHCANYTRAISGQPYKLQPFYLSATSIEKCISAAQSEYSGIYVYPS